MTVETLQQLFEGQASPYVVASAKLEARARSLQRHYARVVHQAVWGGLGGLLCTFASLSFDSHWVLNALEVVCLTIMGVGVAEGLWRGYHHHWILERHRAERLRLLRFDWLINPDHWDLPDDALPKLEAELRQLVGKIETIDEAGMKQWSRDLSWPDVVLPSRALSPAFVDALRREYVATRLDDQLRYFMDMAARRERLDTVTWILPVIGFGLAIVLSLVHMAISGTTTEDEPARRGVLLFLILALPTAGAAARLVRTAFEFARNRQRFLVTALELERTRGRLEGTTDPLRIARAMARAEFTLENEHRAWLLLMTEAEWFG